MSMPLQLIDTPRFYYWAPVALITVGVFVYITFKKDAEGGKRPKSQKSRQVKSDSSVVAQNEATKEDTKEKGESLKEKDTGVSQETDTLTLSPKQQEEEKSVKMDKEASASVDQTVPEPLVDEVAAKESEASSPESNVTAMANKVESDTIATTVEQQVPAKDQVMDSVPSETDPSETAQESSTTKDTTIVEPETKTEDQVSTVTPADDKVTDESAVSETVVESVVETVETSAATESQKSEENVITAETVTTEIKVQVDELAKEEKEAEVPEVTKVETEVQVAIVDDKVSDELKHEIAETSETPKAVQEEVQTAETTAATMEEELSTKVLLSSNLTDSDIETKGDLSSSETMEPKVETELAKDIVSSVSEPGSPVTPVRKSSMDDSQQKTTSTDHTVLSEASPAVASDEQEDANRILNLNRSIIDSTTTVPPSGNSASAAQPVLSQQPMVPSAIPYQGGDFAMVSAGWTPPTRSNPFQQQSEWMDPLALSRQGDLTWNNYSQFLRPHPTNKKGKMMASREDQIQKQQQTYIPPLKARCVYWPGCTNKNCKYWHPSKPCRAGDDCTFGSRCLFLHPKDLETRPKKKRSGPKKPSTRRPRHTQEQEAS